MGASKPAGEIIPDPRKAPRAPFETKVMILHGGIVSSALTWDLTPDGAFLVSDVDPPDAARVGLAIEMEDGQEAIAVQCRVVRIFTSPEGINGFAVEFEAIEADDAQRILDATQGR